MAKSYIIAPLPNMDEAIQAGPGVEMVVAAIIEMYLDPDPDLLYQRYDSIIDAYKDYIHQDVRDEGVEIELEDAFVVDYEHCEYLSDLLYEDIVEFLVGNRQCLDVIEDLSDNFYVRIKSMGYDDYMLSFHYQHESW